eukprot:m.160680 g.160680  ORF g.160680 m.160680 type:complete len:1380 (-) comp14560_c0_seq3:218-4357(-)
MLVMLRRKAPSVAKSRDSAPAVSAGAGGSRASPGKTRSGRKSSVARNVSGRVEICETPEDMKPERGRAATRKTSTSSSTSTSTPSGRSSRRHKGGVDETPRERISERTGTRRSSDRHRSAHASPVTSPSGFPHPHHSTCQSPSSPCEISETPPELIGGGGGGGGLVGTGDAREVCETPEELLISSTQRGTGAHTPSNPLSPPSGGSAGVDVDASSPRTRVAKRRSSRRSGRATTSPPDASTATTADNGVIPETPPEELAPAPRRHSSRRSSRHLASAASPNPDLASSGGLSTLAPPSPASRSSPGSPPRRPLAVSGRGKRRRVERSAPTAPAPTASAIAPQSPGGASPEAFDSAIIGGNRGGGALAARSAGHHRSVAAVAKEMKEIGGLDVADERPPRGSVYGAPPGKPEDDPNPDDDPLFDMELSGVAEGPTPPSPGNGAPPAGCAPAPSPQASAGSTATNTSRRTAASSHPRRNGIPSVAEAFAKSLHKLTGPAQVHAETHGALQPDDDDPIFDSNGGVPDLSLDEDALFGATPTSAEVELDRIAATALTGYYPPVHGGGPAAAGPNDGLDVTSEASPLGVSPARWEPYLTAKGIDAMYEWQRDAWETFYRITGPSRRLVYTAPTSGGKTLVADIAMLWAMFTEGRSCVFMLPLVAVVEERVAELKRLANIMPFHVQKLAGAEGIIPPVRRKDGQPTIYVATYEKAAVLVDSLIDDGRMHEIGLVVVDEIHELGQSGRGAKLEILLTRLKQLERLNLMGISATVSSKSVNEISTFLGGITYEAKFRPVVLEQFLARGNALFRIDDTGAVEDTPQRVVSVDNRLAAKAKRLHLAVDAAPVAAELIGFGSEAVPTLVFCGTKQDCESMALALAAAAQNKSGIGAPCSAERSGLLQRLSEAAGAANRVLVQTVPHGIAYHNSTLLMEERDVLAQAFNAGDLHTLCCTSTLAAGVNLRAQQVFIINAGWQWARHGHSVNLYHQIIGRAGRAGLAATGCGYVFAPSSELAKVKAVVTTPIEDVLSQLNENNGEFLRTAVLKAVVSATDMATTLLELRGWLQHTLFAVQSPGAIEAALEDTVTQLVSDGFLRVTDGAITPTNLGNATSRSFIDLREATTVSTILLSCVESVRLNTELQLLSLVVPLGWVAKGEALVLSERKGDLYFKGRQDQDADVFGAAFATLHARASVADRAYMTEVLGDMERYLGLRELPQSRHSKYIKSRTDRAVQLYLAGCLQEIITGEYSTFREVSMKFRIIQANVQDLLRDAAVRAGNLVVFCREYKSGQLRWLGILLSDIQRQLRFGVPTELLPLVDIKGVSAKMASWLVKAGYTSIELLSLVADPHDMVRAVGMKGGRLGVEAAKEIVSKARQRQALLDQCQTD